MERVLAKQSTREKVDIQKMSVKELQKLHFDEEVLFCEKVLRLPPFSREREELLNRGYEFVGAVKEERLYYV